MTLVTVGRFVPKSPFGKGWGEILRFLITLPLRGAGGVFFNSELHPSIGSASKLKLPFGLSSRGESLSNSPVLSLPLQRGQKTATKEDKREHLKERQKHFFY